MSDPARPATVGSSAEVTREELHVRQIDMRGYRRSDGLFEVEGKLLDRKPQAFVHPDGWTVEANAPIHDMVVRLVYDETMQVLEVHAFTHSAPYVPCPEAGRTLQVLVGLHMSSGWNKEVRNRLSGARSCTHLVELLGPMATTAFQSLARLRIAEPPRLDANGRPMLIDSCYAYSAEREVVLRRWPQFHRPPADAA